MSRLWTKAIPDTIECGDPLGWGCVFTLLRPGSKEHARRSLKRLESDPLMRPMMEEQMLAVMKESRRKETKSVLVGPVVEVLSTGATEAADDFMIRLEENHKAGKVDLFSLLGRDQKVEELLALVVSITKDGKPHEFTPEELREDLMMGGEVAEGQYAGQSYGEALTNHLHDFAVAHAVVRAKELEEAAKN